MSFIKRPNKNALAEAIDIYLDEMRSFLIRCLRQVPGASVEEAIERSLRNNLSESFAKNLGQSDDLPSALPVSFFQPIVGHYWEDVFSPQFGNHKKYLGMLSKVTNARNKVSHPPHLRDLDLDFTLEHLSLIVDVLGELRAWDAQRAVSDIRANLVNPEAEAGKKERIRKNLEEQFDMAIASQQETEVWLNAAESNLKEAKIKFQKEVSARENAEELAMAQAIARQEAEQAAQTAESSLKEVEDRAQDAEVAMQEAEKQVQTEAFARRRAELEAQEADSARREADQQAQKEAIVREDAEQQALAEVTARNRAEKAAQTAESSLMETEERAQFAGIALEKAENRIRVLEQERYESRPALAHTQTGRPVDRSSASYELWLIDEILSERISRSLLRRYADDKQIDGRLVHYVNAAASDMTHTTWQNYVANRQQTLHRDRKNGASLPGRQQSSGHLGLHH